MNLTLLATEGFGLNFNLFETNILNWAVVVFGLYKFLPGFLGKMLQKRREGILLELKDAKDRLIKATQALDKAKKDLSSAEEKASQIKADSLKRSESIRMESEKKAIEDGSNALKESLKGEDIEDIKKKTEALVQASMKLGEAIYKSQQNTKPDSGKDDGKDEKGKKDDNVVDADFEEVKDENKEKSA